MAVISIIIIVGMQEVVYRHVMMFALHTEVVTQEIGMMILLALYAIISM